MKYFDKGNIFFIKRYLGDKKKKPRRFKCLQGNNLIFLMRVALLFSKHGRF